MRVLADGKKKFVVLPEIPADMDKITITEALAGEDFSGAVLSSDFDLGPAASDVLDEKSLDVSGNAKELGNGNADGGFTAYRSFLAATGLPDTASTEEKFWALVGDAKGTVLPILIRHSGKKSTEVITTGDEYWYCEYELDVPSSAALEGKLKHRIPGAIRRFTEGFKTIVAATP